MMLRGRIKHIIAEAETMTLDERADAAIGEVVKWAEENAITHSELGPMLIIAALKREAEGE